MLDRVLMHASRFGSNLSRILMACFVNQGISIHELCISLHNPIIVDAQGDGRTKIKNRDLILVYLGNDLL